MLRDSFILKKLLSPKWQNIKINNQLYLGTYIIVLMLVIVACTDEPLNTSKETFISIRVNPETQIDTRDLAGELPGEYPDNIIYTLRILTFDHNSNAIKANDQYNIINSSLDVIKHPVVPGTYNYVFLANEASDIDTKNKLNGITTLSELKEIAYPADAFASDKAIPMMQVIENVEITSDGKANLINGTLRNINWEIRTQNPSRGIYAPGTETGLLILNLDRLAVRLNVLLQSEYDLTADFESLLLANVPDVVPLFQADYPEEITRKTKYTIAKSEFTTVDPLPAGMSWAVQLSRIILPASYALSSKDAISLTVKLNEKYSPSCELEIEENEYTLPYNTWLNFKGTVKKPLEMNIIAKDWSEIYNDWNTEPLYLNVSQTEVNITDFNGARVTFESNGASVRITGIYNHQTGKYNEWAGDAFNQLQWGDEWNRRYKYDYNSSTQTGSGYMDIIVNNYPKTDSIYSLLLTARRQETWDGPGISLTRYIKVNIVQEGLRFEFKLPSDESPHGSSIYVGAFYRNNETGERIIQNTFGGGWWEATVPEEKDTPGLGNLRDWIVISSTPSFDPKVGTSTPGNAEHYEVVPNNYRYESGHTVTGKQRIYFRIGLTSTIPELSLPRYGYIKLRYVTANKDLVALPGSNDAQVQFKDGSSEEIKSWYIYVRQGEEPDKVLSESTKIPGADANLPRASRRFSPYNVTVQDMLDNYTDRNKNYVTVDSTRDDPARRTVLVKYPTQGGALFQWAVPDETYRRRAYYIRSIHENEFKYLGDIPNNAWGGHYEYGRDPFWDTPEGSTVMPFKNYGEVCPPGYRRPNNGVVASTLAKNNTIQEVANSEFLSSLFMEIPIGDAHTDIPNTYPNDPNAENGIVRYTPKAISNATSGFYSDGFFDRYPIQAKEQEFGFIEGVCINDTRAAFRGVLYYNPTTYASLFFPSAGRRDANTGGLQYGGGTGFYQTASLGNQWIDEKGNQFKNAWQMEFSYHPATLSAVLSFASSLRCVVKE